MSLAPGAVNASLTLVALCLLWAAGGPIVTDDLWWHLAMGEVYAQQGPWPDGDPLLHTAHADAPVQHEWLFGVLVHAAERALGLPGLRVLHALAVLAILALADATFRRAPGPRWLARAGVLLFAVLAWPRLFQLRPDLASIAATLLLHRWLLAGREPPTWGRVAASAALFLVWANLHSLFLVGLLLLAAALTGLALEPLLAREGRSAVAARLTKLKRLGVALAAGFAASALNPRGFAQHATFVTSSLETGVWSIADEWLPFHPLAFGHYPAAIGPLSWLAGDLVIALYLGAAIAALRSARRGGPAPDGPALALGLAALVALFVSVRFLWLGFLPLFFALRVVAARGAPGPRLAAAVAAGSLLVALAFPWLTSFAAVASMQLRAGWQGWAAPYVSEKYHPAAVHFLRASGVRGNLFNPYNLGGFLGYWLAPRLRTFVDSRTEHYPKAVLEDYSAVTIQRGARPGETHLDVLERRDVDLFLGVGVPLGEFADAALHTTAHLEDAPGWLPVSRSIRHAVYLRDDAGNRENRERVAAYYREESVPFDPDRGFDPVAVISARPDWAARHGILPRDHAALLAALHSEDAGTRFAALDRMASIFCLLGAYREQLGLDREAARLRPRADAPLRRTVYALLRLGRHEEARAAAAVLARRAGDDPRAQSVQRLAARVATLAPARSGPAAARGVPARTAPLTRFPVFTREEYARVAEGFEAPRLPARAPGRYRDAGLGAARDAK